ncbi:MAG: hypothetical protein LIP16_20105 [Clostridium sp.]|nr:hypothetical protein [Clostridium sp.]
MLCAGVKYCGNCNPSMDMPGLINKLASQAPWIQFVRWDSGEADCLLILHGCRRACTVIPEFAGKLMEVSCDTIDCRPVGQEELLSVLLEILNSFAVTILKETEK